jgi:dephospho-CoA kinase
MGSGKSTVSAVLRELGFTVLDADEIVRTVLSPGAAGETDVLRAFGAEPGVRDSASGALDRRALGRTVFANPAKLDQLERLIHPRVRDEVARLKSGLEASGAAAAFYDVPLLFEKKMEAQFDRVLVVSAPAASRLSRLVARTGLSVPEIEERWSRQLPPEYKEARASAVILNSGDLAALKSEVLSALKKLGVALPTPAHAKS